jgi:hypothetical protein
LSHGTKAGKERPLDTFIVADKFVFERGRSRKRDGMMTCLDERSKRGGIGFSGVKGGWVWWSSQAQQHAFIYIQGDTKTLGTGLRVANTPRQVHG